MNRKQNVKVTLSKCKVKEINCPSTKFRKERQRASSYEAKITIFIDICCKKQIKIKKKHSLLFAICNHAFNKCDSRNR